MPLRTGDRARGPAVGVARRTHHFNGVLVTVAPPATVSSPFSRPDPTLGLVRTRPAATARYRAPGAAATA